MTESIKKARQIRRRNIEPSNTSFRSAAVKDRKMDELIGLVRGLLADKKLAIEEVVFLKNWIESNPEIRDLWPATEIYQKLSSVDTLNSEEEDDLKKYLEKVIGGSPDAVFDGEVEKPTELAFNTDDDIEVEIPSKTFCLTGSFVSGKRKDIADEIEALGGRVINSVSSKLDYLVVGTYSSKEWMHSSFGRKIEKALELGTAVIREQNLINAIQALKA